MPWSRWVIVSLGVLLGGWLAFDGVRALTLGDYVTPRSGTHAGHLGPWSHVVSALGIGPRSTWMKGAHVVLVLLWLAAAAGLAAGMPWAWWGVLGCSVASLWYLPMGTLIGLAQVGLLLLSPPGRRGGGG